LKDVAVTLAIVQVPLAAVFPLTPVIVTLAVDEAGPVGLPVVLAVMVIGEVLLAPVMAVELKTGTRWRRGMVGTCTHLPGPPVVDGVKISAVPVKGSGEVYSPPIVRPGRTARRPIR